MKNKVIKHLPVSGTFKVPAGVKQLTIFAFPLARGLGYASPTAMGMMARKASNDNYAWGMNTSGLLGIGEIRNVSTPTLIVGGRKFVLLAPGDSVSLGITNDGTLYAWGSNATGQLGIGESFEAVPQVSTPTLVSTPFKFKKVAVGTNHFIALRGDGVAFTCGENFRGQLGAGTSSFSESTPVQVTGGHQFIDVQASGSNSAGLKADGSVWCWGDNAYGQIGEGLPSPNHRSTPTQVIGGHSFVQISMGGTHCAALKEDGSVWQWGESSFDGSVIPITSSPILVTGSHSFVRISAGAYYTAGLKEDGTVWFWGNNIMGSFGDGTTDNSSTPVQGFGDHRFIEIQSTSAKTYGLKRDGSIWASGYNDEGQLGDGTTTSSLTPVQVVGGHLFSSSVQPLGHFTKQVTPGEEIPFSSESPSFSNFGDIQLETPGIQFVLEYEA